MVITDVIRKVVFRKYLVQQNSDNSFVLSEGNMMKVKVLGLDKNAIVIRLEDFCYLHLKEGNWSKCCDYLIIKSEGNQVKVLFVELKRDGKEYPTGFEQLRRSVPRYEHLISICQTHAGNLKRPPSSRYVVLANKDVQGIAKTVTKPGSFDIYRDVRTYKKLKMSLCLINDTVHFNQLWERKDA